MIDTDDRLDRLYQGLRGARVRLRMAQELAPRGWQYDELAQAIVHIERVGAMLPQWPQYEATEAAAGPATFPDGTPLDDLPAYHEPSRLWTVLGWARNVVVPAVVGAVVAVVMR